MTVDEAMKYADECAGYSGKGLMASAIIALAAEVMRLREQNDALGVIADTAVTDMDGWIECADSAGEEIERLMVEINLLTHKIITCGVAASHIDRQLTRTGAYATTWDSPQAEQVRVLRSDSDRYQDALKLVIEYDPYSPGAGIAREALGDVV